MRKCPKCGREMTVFHRNEHCQVAGAMSPESPPAHITECSIEGCMQISCEHCGFSEEN